MSWFSGKDETLEKAIDADDPAALASAVREGANVNAKGRVSVTPLMYAIGHFRKRTYTELLRLKADPNQRDDESDNAMTLATRAFAKDHDYLLLALKAGGDPNAREHSGDPILIRFINDRNLQAIRLMKEAGADINVRNRSEDPLIIYAGIVEYWDVVWCLLELGAKFDYKDASFPLSGAFNQPKVTPPDSPLYPYKLKSWTFLRDHGMVLPDLPRAQ